MLHGSLVGLKIPTRSIAMRRRRMTLLSGDRCVTIHSDALDGTDLQTVHPSDFYLQIGEQMG